MVATFLNCEFDLHRHTRIFHFGLWSSTGIVVSNLQSQLATSACNFCLPLLLATSACNFSLQLQLATSACYFCLELQLVTSACNFSLPLLLATSACNFSLQLQLATSACNFSLQLLLSPTFICRDCHIFTTAKLLLNNMLYKIQLILCH